LRGGRESFNKLISVQFRFMHKEKKINYAKWEKKGKMKKGKGQNRKREKKEENSKNKNKNKKEK